MSDKEIQLATFAGGCFWCMVKPFDTYPGVVKVVSGYTGGHKENPTYAQVTAGLTGHFEAVQITFDPELLSYADLLEMFWRQIDPTDDGGQFADRGSSYKTAIFYHNEQQKEMAEASREKQAERFNMPIATRILPAKKFWPAEDYHQDFYKKNPAHYQAYRRGSGRDAYIASVWEKDEKDE